MCIVDHETHHSFMGKYPEPRKLFPSTAPSHMVCLVSISISTWPILCLCKLLTYKGAPTFSTLCLRFHYGCSAGPRACLPCLVIFEYVCACACGGVSPTKGSPYLNTIPPPQQRSLQVTAVPSDPHKHTSEHTAHCTEHSRYCLSLCWPLPRGYASVETGDGCGCVCRKS